MSPHQPNRLAKETSPYLLQHQHNPVDWYPWGEEAFAAARDQDKPIFLSVGYSTCYWCHVMERQCFENEAIAMLMNERFINIKVDREERPDVDQLYMTGLQVLTRTGGWPMSLWLLPDKRMFFAGTYFPPEDAHGRPGFPNILTGLADAYRDSKPDVMKTAEQLQGVLQELAKPSGTDEALTLSADWIAPLLLRCIDDYEPRFGGFGGAPKFPRETLLDLLLWAKTSKIVTDDMKTEIDRPLRHALDAMANGGIRDHLGGAFHRYSTDAQWLVPHFEIMLYDNALLGRIYAQASVTLNEPRYADVARRVFDFILSEMTNSDGLFYTAFDAEVDAREGLNYLWTMSQVEEVLDPREAARFAAVYGLSAGPNFADPHHGPAEPDVNVLFLAKPEEENAPDIIAMREKLFQQRQSRKKPLLDTKIITSWNALTIRGLAVAGRVLNEPRYTEAAVKAAGNLWHEHREADGTFFRTSSNHVRKHLAMLDDYAFFAEALAELGHSKEAYELVTTMRARFEDAADGAFFFSDMSADDLVVRQKIAADSPLPAGNAIAATVCDTLGFAETAARALAAFAVQANHHGPSMCATVQAIGQFIEKNGPLRVEATTSETSRVATPAELAEQSVDVLWKFVNDTRIAVELRIVPGLHLTASTIELASPDVAIAGIERPMAEQKTYAYAEAPVDIYEGSATFHVRLHQPLTADDTLKLSLTYQPCSDNACLPTTTRTIEITK
ncbi:MAG: Thioredoxin-related protein [Phycisphaerales bacterium]|nr:Thioredoxin-related protein [Phycisphaerales bacterium]